MKSDTGKIIKRGSLFSVCFLSPFLRDPPVSQKWFRRKRERKWGNEGGGEREREREERREREEKRRSRQKSDKNNVRQRRGIQRLVQSGQSKSINGEFHQIIFPFSFFFSFIYLFIKFTLEVIGVVLQIIYCSWVNIY